MRIEDCKIGMKVIARRIPYSDTVDNCLWVCEMDREINKPMTISRVVPDEGQEGRVMLKESAWRWVPCWLEHFTPIDEPAGAKVYRAGDRILWDDEPGTMISWDEYKTHQSDGNRPPGAEDDDIPIQFDQGRIGWVRKTSVNLKHLDSKDEPAAQDWSIKALRNVKTVEEAKRWIGTDVRTKDGIPHTLAWFCPGGETWDWAADSGALYIRVGEYTKNRSHNPDGFNIIAVLSPPAGAIQNKEKDTPPAIPTGPCRSWEEGPAKDEPAPKADDDGRECIDHDSRCHGAQDDIIQVLCLMCGRSVPAKHEKAHRQSIECIRARGPRGSTAIDSWKCHCGAVGRYIDLERPFTDCPACGGEVQDT